MWNANGRATAPSSSRRRWSKSRSTNAVFLPASSTTVPQAIDLQRFSPAPSDLVYSAFDFPRDRKVVVYAGHVIRRKGIPILIEAAKELLLRRSRNDVAFLICGNRNGDSAEFAAQFVGLGLERLIQFGGYRGDMNDIFRSAFCGVIATTGWDSFPRTPLEMAACGLPVVASRLQGLEEQVRHQSTGLLFKPGDAGELADCLEALLDDPQRAAQMGREGRVRCEAEFGLESQYSKYLGVLRKRCGGRDEVRRA